MTSWFFVLITLIPFVQRCYLLVTSLVAQMVKRLPTVQETWVRSLGQEDLLEKEMATHSSILAWKIPWMEKPGRLQSMGSQRVGHERVTSLSHKINYGPKLKILSFSWSTVCSLTTTEINRASGVRANFYPVPGPWVYHWKHLFLNRVCQEVKQTSSISWASWALEPLPSWLRK